MGRTGRMQTIGQDPWEPRAELSAVGILCAFTAIGRRSTEGAAGDLGQAVDAVFEAVHGPALFVMRCGFRISACANPAVVNNADQDGEVVLVAEDRYPVDHGAGNEVRAVLVVDSVALRQNDHPAGLN